MTTLPLACNLLANYRLIAAAYRSLVESCSRLSLTWQRHGKNAAFCSPSCYRFCDTFQTYTWRLRWCLHCGTGDEEGPIFYQMEQLIFMSKDYSCAVVMTTLIGTHVFIAPTRWYELRVRNSSIATGPHEDCLQEFTDVAYSRRIVYTPDCQRFALFDDVK
nr:uncharacterized protein LOC126534079 isoform X2 [Dermacentor andersoni]